jgi:hypothetical protein
MRQEENDNNNNNKKKRKRTHDEEEEDDDVFATWELRPESGRAAAGLDPWRLRRTAERDEVARRKEDMYVLGKLSCFVHCDFPSECRYARDKALQRWLQNAEDRAGQEGRTLDAVLSS